LLTATGAGALIGPGRFKSGVGIVKWLLEHKTSLCIQDELGAVFTMLADPKTNLHVRDINETLRELWAFPGAVTTAHTALHVLAKAFDCGAAFYV
jgi:hypothetical protein